MQSREKTSDRVDVVDDGTCIQMYRFNVTIVIDDFQFVDDALSLMRCVNDRAQ